MSVLPLTFNFIQRSSDMMTLHPLSADWVCQTLSKAALMRTMCSGL